MSNNISLKGTKLEKDDQEGVIEFCESLRGKLKSDLESVMLYGSGARKDYRPGKSDINLLVVVKNIDLEALKSLTPSVEKGRRYGIAPLIMTEKDIATSTDAFPVKFLSIKESYNVLLGKDVMKDLSINRDHIRLRSEQEIKNLLMRMRRFYLANNGQGLTGYMVQSIGGFLENLRMVISISQEDIPNRESVIDVASQKFGIDSKTLKSVQSLKNRTSPLPREEEEKLFGEFLNIVGKMAEVADQLEKQPPGV